MKRPQLNKPNPRLLLNDLVSGTKPPQLTAEDQYKPLSLLFKT